MSQRFLNNLAMNVYVYESQGIIRVSLDWGAFSHRLFLQAPSKQKGEDSVCVSVCVVMYVCMYVRMYDSCYE